uniref:ubiquitinyl hydrolase 1 n=1 Tax=Picocystis salinarum TaxID=88271 RepID=A0A7S3UBD8_9CHLO|mmetsp:Transcript_3826/g.24231  ORF Transcript_3826/g.24231 Transcript_3826/m.24231 type:complete len:375 (+) Transcript_3826:133-1257(+)
MSASTPSSSTAPTQIDKCEHVDGRVEKTSVDASKERSGTKGEGHRPNVSETTTCLESKRSNESNQHEAEGPTVVLYHESQVASLCGMHCLNALLQGPAFNEWDLGMVAQEVDEAERKLMAEGGTDTHEYAEFLVKQLEDSENVSSDGNFSLQVLHKALEVWGIKVSPLLSVHSTLLEVREAFLCLTSRHWFAIRKVGGNWYNFNSKLPAPVEVAEDSLLAYLTAMIENPHQSVFDVEGQLPVVGQENANESGTWLTPLDAHEILQHEPPETFHTAWALGDGPIDHKDDVNSTTVDILHLKVHAMEDLFLDMEASRVCTVDDFLKDICHVLGLEPMEYNLETGSPRKLLENPDASLEEVDTKEGQVIYLVRKSQE